MNLLNWQNHFEKELQTLYSRAASRDLFKRIIRGLFNWEPTVVALDPQRIPSQEKQQLLHHSLNELKAERPLQYILGHTYFMGLRLTVNAATLIPRPETEELVSWVLEETPVEHPNVLDIGTGSGCIALAIKQFQPRWQLHALDVSQPALDVAKTNSKNLELAVHFIGANIETAIPRTAYDIIVSNPPYVTHKEKIEMKANVLEYEPHQALFAPVENPLHFYEAIFRFSQNGLRDAGILYFEINPIYCQALKELAVSFGLQNIQVRKDLFGKQRFIRIQK